MGKNSYRQELFTDKWMVSQSYIEKIKNLFLTDIDSDPEPITIKGCSQSHEYTQAAYSGSEEDSIWKNMPADTIAIIPLMGVMTKLGSWWSYGVDDIANLIRSANQAKNIAGIILQIHSPGGSVFSVFEISNAISKATKPVYSIVSGMSMSAAEYVRSHTSKSYALAPMVEFGSIGVYATFYDETEADKKYGIKTIVVYPPESSKKNLPEREALEGKPDLMITEVLSPWAQHFQEVIKKNLSLKGDLVDDILAGKAVYAEDALSSGLIHGIADLDQVVDEMYKEIQSRKSIY